MIGRLNEPLQPYPTKRPSMLTLIALGLTGGGVAFINRYGLWAGVTVGTATLLGVCLFASYGQGTEPTSVGALLLAGSGVVFAIGSALEPRWRQKLSRSASVATSAQSVAEEDLMRLRNQIGSQGYGFAPDGTVEGGIPPRSLRDAQRDWKAP